MEKTSITFECDGDLAEALRAGATDSERSVSAYIRYLLRLALDKCAE